MKLALALLAIALTGCASQAEKQASVQAHYDAQKNFITASKEANQPIFELVAKDGEQITLGGVKSLTVRANQPVPEFRGAPAQTSDVVQIFDRLMGTAERITPWAFGARIVGKVMENTGSTDNSVSNTTSTTSAVGANSGTNSGNSGTLKSAGNDLTDSTSIPTVVTQPAPVVVPQPAPVVVPTPVCVVDPVTGLPVCAP